MTQSEPAYIIKCMPEKDLQQNEFLEKKHQKYIKKHKKNRIKTDVSN